MDHLKRKMEGQFASTFVRSDLKTPPYAPPLHYHEESALRSTQAPQGYEPSNVSGLHLHDHVAAKPRRLPDWRSTQSAAVHDASSKAEGRARSAAPAVQPPYVDVQGSKDEILEVDTRFGHDSVYLFNVAADSKSFTLASEDDPEVQATLPPQAELAIKRVKRAQALADASSHVRPNPNTASAKESDDEDTPVKVDFFGTRCDTPRVFIDSPRLNATPSVIELQKLKYNKDLHLRNTMRLVKAKLTQGATLIVERRIDDKQLIKCEYSECPALDQIIMPGNYFVVIGDAKVPKDAEAWCLTCLESLWAGEGIIGALPVPEPASNALCGYNAPLSRAPSMELDGTIARLSNLRVDGSYEDKEALPSSSHDLSNEFTERTMNQIYDTTSIPQSLLSSKHAPTSEELAGYPLTFQFPSKLPSPPFEDRPETPGSPYTPSSSQMSSKEATTRFQHLAHYITGGKSLDDEEQATLALWQKTSIEQVGGGEDPEEYGRAIMKHLREHCAKADDETSEADKDAAWEELAGQFDWVEESRQIDESIFCVLEFVSGLTKGDVAARDLSDAFADMNTVRKEE
ncbi:hypothetical protein KC331_g14571 [Hortaea werneckii]|nr:hypothetical protein KC331_g14571 [Hortaea werneckii]KAI7703595.1 hypothetical protein KC353_g14024 [Hortaea werneckii]